MSAPASGMKKTTLDKRPIVLYYEVTAGIIRPAGLIINTYF